MLLPAYRHLWHWLHRVDAHSLHSPLLFDFYNQVIRPKDHQFLPHLVENLIREARQDKRKLQRTDLGAGSKAHGTEVSLSTLAKYSTSSPAMRQLLYNLARWKRPETILELGTSLGFTTMTLASAYPGASIYTIEGCPQTAAIAAEHFKRGEMPGILSHVGDIEERLPTILEKTEHLDLVYMDANHQYEPTLAYFSAIKPYLRDNSVVVIGDISWSAGMQKAWQEIVNQPEVSAAADLLETGVLFFKPLPQKLFYAMSMPRASVAR